MSKSPTPYLKHILEETSFLLSVFDNSGQTLAGFINDVTLKRAVVRSIEIIGEASKKNSLFLQAASFFYRMEKYG